MSRLIRAIACGLLLTVSLSLCGFAGECREIRSSVVRLHVLANSDSDEDQALKLKVRDAVVAASAGLFDETRNAAQAKEQAAAALPALLEIAQKTVEQEGYAYSVNAEICNMYFTTRQYETFTLPAGRYEALRFTIGTGAGKNWWCVVFPPLCVSAAARKATLSDVLDETQQDIVSHPQKYEIRLKSVEIFEDIAHKWQEWFGQDS